MKEILKFLRPYIGALLLATAAVAVSNVCELLLPTLMSQILDRGVQGAEVDYVIKCCGVMLLVSLVSLASVLLGSKISSRVVAGFCGDIRAAVFAKGNAMRFEEFGKLGASALVSRATHDVQTVSWIASELCGTVITIPLLFAGGVALSMWKDVTLALILLAFVPVILAVVLYIGRKILPLWEASDDYIDKQNALVRQRLRGIRVIRAFNAEDQEHEKIANATRTMAEYIIRGNVSMGLITPLATFLLNCAALLIVYAGGLRMDRGSGLSGADIFAIIQYVSLVSGAVVMGAFTVIMLPHARVAAGRIGQVLKTEGYREPEPHVDAPLKGEIRFDRVSFCYEGASVPALDAVSFHICPGQTVAIIGGTGAGKSTVVSMLMGFREPTGGSVSLDGIPLEKRSRRAVRREISCVLQNATIYSGTVRENLRMGRENAAEEALWDALRAAQAEEFVSRLPDGLDHKIRQSGKNLSGGQKQRLSIARALLKEAPIYIFDDSFSALDFLTEANLRRCLARRLKGKTRIVITQRVTSAMHCDCILVMDQGRLVDSGTHEELLSRCGVYREIYASQTGGDPV